MAKQTTQVSSLTINVPANGYNGADFTSQIDRVESGVGVLNLYPIEGNGAWKQIFFGGIQIDNEKVCNIPAMWKEVLVWLCGDGSTAETQYCIKLTRSELFLDSSSVMNTLSIGYHHAQGSIRVEPINIYVSSGVLKVVSLAPISTVLPNLRVKKVFWR